jgi:hypothetical protein
MDDDKHDLPYPYDQDFSGLLRCNLPNSRVTAAVMRAVVQLVKGIFEPVADPKKSLLRFLTQDAVVKEVKENVPFGCQATENALRWRWLHQREFYADIFRFGQAEWHFPGGHQEEIAGVTEQIIHGDDPVGAIRALCDWAIQRRVSTPMSLLSLLAVAEAGRDEDIRAAIAEHHRENAAIWKAYCEEFLRCRHLRVRDGITLDDCVTLITSMATGITMRAITDPEAVFDSEQGCLFGSGVIALIISCAEPDDQADRRPFDGWATAAITGAGAGTGGVDINGAGLTGKEQQS